MHLQLMTVYFQSVICQEAFGFLLLLFQMRTLINIRQNNPSFILFCQSLFSAGLQQYFFTSHSSFTSNTQMDLIFPFKDCHSHGICFHVSLCYIVNEIIYFIAITQSSNTPAETLTFEDQSLCVCNCRDAEGSL